MLVLVLVWVTFFLLVLMSAVVLLSNADGEEMSAVANFGVLVLVVVIMFALSTEWSC